MVLFLMYKIKIVWYNQVITFAKPLFWFFQLLAIRKNIRITRNYFVNKKFVKAIESFDKKAMEDIKKADLHSHTLYSMDREYLEREGHIIPKSEGVCDIASLIDFSRKYIKPIIQTKQGLKILIEGMIEKCKLSGVSIVDSDIDFKICMITFDSNVAEFINFLKQFENKDLKIRWVLDISRDSYNQEIHEELLERLIESGYFYGIDLTSTENIVPNHIFKNIYDRANGLGMVTKIHAGEQLGSGYIKDCIVELNPKQIQHGISIVSDPNVMKLAREKGIVFNVCPTSNVVLGYAKDIKTHPIREMVKNGLRVTIATDDILFFESDINDEYLKLYKENVLTANELDRIREFGLSL